MATSTGEVAGLTAGKRGADDVDARADEEDSVLGVEEEPGVRRIRLVYSGREDTAPLSDKLREAMQQLDLDPYEWQPGGPPVFTDADGGSVKRGQLSADTIAFPLTAEIRLNYVRDLTCPDDSDEDAQGDPDEVGSVDPERGSENPFDSGIYAAPTMSEEELAAFTVPFSKVSTEIRAVLDKYGIVMVPDVIPKEELASLEADFAQDLNDLVDEQALSEAGPEAADAREAYKEFRAVGPRAFPVQDIARFTAAAGFSVKRCVSHGRFAWRVRRHPNVRAVYQAIYPEAGDLVSSMDVTFFTPDGQSAQQWNRFSAHVDQNMNDVRPRLAECDSFQGVLYAWPSTADGNSSTTVVWPGSHRTVWPQMMEDTVFEQSGDEGFHYSEIKEMNDPRLARALADGWARHARRAVVPSGGLFIWNSRTVHTGWRGGPRLAQTVCFEPADRRSEAQRLAKLRLAALGLPSTHWASVGMQHDMILGDPGYTVVQEKQCPWKPRTSGSSSKRLKETLSGLPLRRAIRPAGLVESADLQALARLARGPYRLTGMWDPPDGVGDLLDASVKDEFKSIL